MGREEAGVRDAVSGALRNGPAVATGDAGALRLRAIRLEYFTISWNIIEAVVAIAAGWAASSMALIGFGLDSVIETASGAALLWRFKQRGLDEATAESRALKLVGLTFFLLAAYVGYEAAEDLLRGHEADFSLAGAVLAAVSLIVMPVLGVAKRRAARALGSRALAADAKETLLCASLSATLLAGLLLNGLWRLWWADPLAALAIAGFMVREGWEIFSGDDD